ncbi:MAG: hypothetical protein V1747_00810 [Candidatus Omnitrophota bacterium]
MEEEKKQEEVKAEEIQENEQESTSEVKEESKQAQPKDKKPPKVEIPKSCGSCKKPVAKTRYYRNMQFFCNTKCWKDFKKKEAQIKLKAAEEKKQQEQAPAA